MDRGSCRFWGTGMFRVDTWRFMGTSSPNDICTHDLLRGLRGLISAAIIGL